MKTILYIILTVLMATVAYAGFNCQETLSVSTNSPVQAGQTTSATFTVTGAESSGWVAVGNTISLSGGCTFSTGQTQINDFFMFPSDNPKIIQVRTPNSAATCTLSGSYFFGDCGDKNLNTATIQVGGSQACTSGQTQSCMVGSCAGTQTCSNGNWGACVKNDPDCGTSCTDTSWIPSPSSKCSGTSFTQTSNCGNTRSATGTKNCDNGNGGNFLSECVYETEGGTCISFAMILGLIGLFFALSFLK